MIVSGADLLDGTPILDIKPYLPFTDSHPDASGGFAAAYKDYALSVKCDAEKLALIPEDKREALLAVLAEDPRPSYQNDSDRIYGFPFAGREVRFVVCDGVLTVVEIE